jgi:RHH-type proline utilization regulon transcriptional repressor/proline dehydrogenase/delta 1-pyrroline-5-carboxylate dehydrogenase
LPGVNEKDLQPFRADYAPSDKPLVEALLKEAAGDPVVEKLIDQRARGYIDDMRSVQVGLGGVEDFLREYGLSTREGLALMVLAEALLRVPDAKTADKLIEDKLAAARFDESEHGPSDTWLVSASSWALGVTSQLIHPGEKPNTILASAWSKRMGMPTVRAATRQSHAACSAISSFWGKPSPRRR